MTAELTNGKTREMLDRVWSILHRLHSHSVLSKRERLAFFIAIQLVNIARRVHDDNYDGTHVIDLTLEEKIRRVVRAWIPYMLVTRNERMEKVMRRELELTKSERNIRDCTRYLLEAEENVKLGEALMDERDDQRNTSHTEDDRYSHFVTP